MSTLARIFLGMVVTAHRYPGTGLLGESPRWDHRLGILWWVDAHEAAGVLHGFDPRSLTDRIITKSKREGLGCVALEKNGNLLLGLNRDIVRWSISTETTSHVATVDADEGCVINDCGCDPNGRLWLGTIRIEAGEISEGGHLHRQHGDAGPRVLPMKMANGIGWSPDAETMYVADSWKRQVLAYAYNVSSGALVTESESVFVSEGQFDRAMPDGLCVDKEGGVWVAHNGADLIAKPGGDGRVVRYIAGEPAAEIIVPNVHEVTACAFGGDDLSTLFVTTMRDPRGPSYASREGGSLFAASVNHEGLEPREVDLCW